MDYSHTHALSSCELALALTRTQMAEDHLLKFLSSCDFLSLAADESDTFSGSAPMAASLQGCNSSFEWLNAFVGQIDVAADKTGSGLHDALKKLIDELDGELWEKIIFLCTDGASAMRSIAAYMGLDSNPEGSSLHAMMKRTINPLLPNLHCLPHMLNLAFKFAFLKSGWAESWLLHVKSVFVWFSKSPGRKNALKRLHKAMRMLRRVVTWRMVYPRYYCPTRWLGLHQALLSILAAWDLLLIYADNLVTEDGYRPDRRPYASEPTVDELNGEDVTNARRENDDDGVTRVHEASFHQWDDNSWDLKVNSIAGDEAMLTSEELINLDHGVSEEWSRLQDGSRGKRSKLLSEAKGLTNVNYGINSMMADILLPYTILVQKLQTTSTPVAHRVCHWVHQFFNQMNRSFLGESPTWGLKFKEWRAKVKASCTSQEDFEKLEGQIMVKQ